LKSTEYGQFQPQNRVKKNILNSMKRYLKLFFIFVTLASCDTSKNNDQSTAKNSGREIINIGDFSYYSDIDTTETVLIETHWIQRAGQKSADTLILENLQDLVGDPQIYSIVKFKDANRIIELKNVAGYKIDLSTKIGFKNLVNSDLVYLIENEFKEKILFIWDFQYPDCTTRFVIYKITDLGIEKIYADNIIVQEISRGSSANQLTITFFKDCDEIESHVTLDL